MLSRPSQTKCPLSKSLRMFPSTLLFLSLILPTPSFAQITNPPPSTALSTSLSTSQNPAFMSSSPATPLSASPSTTESDTSITPLVSPTDPDEVQEHVFNYYFLIIAVVAVLFCTCLFYVGRRKRLKTQLLRSQSERALATDVAGFRARFGNRTGRTSGVEGLDERGEAPPPYVPGSKPPSVRSTDRFPTAIGVSANGLELGDLYRPQPIHQPPSYNEYAE